MLFSPGGTSSQGMTHFFSRFLYHSVYMCFFSSAFLLFVLAWHISQNESTQLKFRILCSPQSFYQLMYCEDFGWI